MNITLRHEEIKDHTGIRLANELAFKQPDEGILVEKLRLKPGFIDKLSIVASLNDRIIGHILFFPIKIMAGSKHHDSLSLAPMCVIPEFQNRGIGGQLITKGLQEAAELGYQSVIVLGHRNYYPKFGFVPAGKWNIKAPWELPEGVFMALELVKDGLGDVSGVVEYPEEFNDVR